MKRFELKNIAIVILLLANLYLAGILFQRYQEQAQSRDRTTSEMLTLFQSQGVHIDGALLSWDDPLQQLELGADLNLYQTIAKSLLNEEVAATPQEDGSLLYQNQLGTVSFYSNGTLEANGTFSDDDALSEISSFCHTYGYENLVTVLDGNSGTVTANATYRGIAVTQTSMVFTLEHGVLTHIAGNVLPQTHTLTGAAAQVSCLSALSGFLSARRASGAVVSTVSQVDACYALTPTPSSPLTLLPIWLIVTDNGTYLVDGGTGQVTYR